jgi:hypothetical protein
METRHKYIKLEEVRLRGNLALKEIERVDPDLVVIFDDNTCARRGLIFSCVEARRRRRWFSSQRKKAG